MKKILFCVIFIIFLIPTVSGEEGLYKALDVPSVIQAVPPGADVEFSGNISLADGIMGILNKIKQNILTFFESGIKCVAIICAVSFLCSTVESLEMGGGQNAVRSTLSLVGAIAVTAAASGSITSVIGMGKEFISGIETFSKALLPSVAAAEAACGLPGAATIKAGITLLFSDILITLISSVLLPLVYVNIFAATSNAAAKNAALQKISEFSTKIVSITLKILLGAFVSYISVSGLVSGSADKAGLKLAQLALGSTVPIVGATVSEAAETVIAGAAMMKNAIGVFGMLSILSAFASPFAAMLVNYFTFKAASLIASPVIGGSIAELSSRIAESFGLVLAMCASVATVIIVAIIAAMRSVGVL